MSKLIGSIKFFILIINVVYVWSDCEISREAADTCGMKATLFGNRERTVPSSEAELDSMCGQFRQNAKCLNDFNDKCLTGKVHMAVEIALNNGRAFIDKRCNKPKDRAEFLQHVKCIVPKEKMEAMHICADKQLVMMTKLKEINKADRVASLCCIAHLAQQCMREGFKKHCNEDTQGYWDDAWDELTSSNMEFACEHFDTLAKCDSGLNPAALKLLKDVANSNDADALKARHEHKSEITTAIELMEFLDL